VGVIAGKPLPSRCPVENWLSHHLIAMIPLIVLQVHCQRPPPSASLRPCDQESLPSIVSKQYASEGDETTDHDGRRRRPRHALWLPPCCHGDRHGVSAVPSSGPHGLAECIAPGVFASMSPSFLLPVLSMVVGCRVEESKRQRQRCRGHQVRMRDAGSHWIAGSQESSLVDARAHIDIQWGSVLPVSGHTKMMAM
jgi:hypothetical protein